MPRRGRVTSTKGSEHRQHAAAPPGWHYNPSAWKQRVPIVAMAMLAFAAATHLALYQVRSACCSSSCSRCSSMPGARSAC